MRTLKINKFIDKSIKVGDIIRIHDGSGLSLLNDLSTKDHYIVKAYPELTGSGLILKEIDGTVIDINIKYIHSVPSIGSYWCYKLDCIIQLGNAKFRTCSKFIHKI